MKRPIGALVMLLLLVTVVSYGENRSENKNAKSSPSEWIDVDEKPTFFETVEINGVKQTRYLSREERETRYQDRIRKRNLQKPN